MDDRSATPVLGALEIPIDQWTKPFWDAAGNGDLRAPQCADCDRYRWPPGPFCPRCRSQNLRWRDPGRGVIYSYTIIAPRDDTTAPPAVPALIEFPDADGIRIVAAVIDTPLAALRIGAPVKVSWLPAANAMVPAFSIVMNTETTEV